MTFEIGQKASVHGSYGVGVLRVTTITSVTARKVTCSDRSAWTLNGDRWGTSGAWTTLRLVEYKPGDEEKVLRKNRINLLSRNRVWEKFSDEDLAAIVEIVGRVEGVSL